jgi:ABC-type uncharacterized transport system involved in gliding motility auxiliary subunit
MTPVKSLLRKLTATVERPLVDGFFVLLLLGTVIAAGWLIARHDHYWDLTVERSNSLSPESLEILRRVEDPLRATVFIDPQDPLLKTIERLLARYEQTLPDMGVQVVDPQLFPEQARDAKVSIAGQVLLEYRGRRETLSEIGERALSAAIARLTTTRAPWVAVLEGHGERRIDGEAPADLGRLGKELKDRGYLLRPLDLATVPNVPVNTHLAVVSTPSISLFPGEAERLAEYLNRGGNLLWLLDPGPLNGLEVLADQLGIGILPGTVVDAGAAAFGVDSPAVAVISEYPDDPLADGLKEPALLPGAVAFETRVAPGWTLASFLTSGADSWNETGRIQGNIFRDEVIGEQAGPLPVVLALTRSIVEGGTVQRVLVVGDGDFLSNAQIGAHGNGALGIKMLRWLSGEEGLLALPPNPDPAEGLELTASRRWLLGLSSLVLLPAFFLTAGLAMRWVRSRG